MTQDPITLDRLDPNTVLAEAQKGELTEVLVLGLRPDGKLYAASSTSDIGTAFYMMEVFRHQAVTDQFDA